jgi:hypothetical protein
VADAVIEAAFHVDSRQDVDQLYAQLLAIGAEVLAPPTEYAYTPGYYAVACRDPDGLVLGLCMNPNNGGTSAETRRKIAASLQVIDLKEATKHQKIGAIKRRNLHLGHAAFCTCLASPTYPHHMHFR